MLILQNEKLYSMSKDKVIKVWDVPAQAIMQVSIFLKHYLQTLSESSFLADLYYTVC